MRLPARRSLAGLLLAAVLTGVLAGVPGAAWAGTSGVRPGPWEQMQELEATARGLSDAQALAILGAIQDKAPSGIFERDLPERLLELARARAADDQDVRAGVEHEFGIDLAGFLDSLTQAGAADPEAALLELLAQVNRRVREDEYRASLYTDRADLGLRAEAERVVAYQRVLHTLLDAVADELAGDGQAPLETAINRALARPEVQAAVASVTDQPAPLLEQLVEAARAAAAAEPKPRDPDVWEPWEVNGAPPGLTPAEAKRIAAVLNGVLGDQPEAAPAPPPPAQPAQRVTTRSLTEANDAATRAAEDAWRTALDERNKGLGGTDLGEAILIETTVEAAAAEARGKADDAKRSADAIEAREGADAPETKAARANQARAEQAADRAENLAGQTKQQTQKLADEKVGAGQPQDEAARRRMEDYLQGVVGDALGSTTKAQIEQAIEDTTRRRVKLMDFRIEGSSTTDIAADADEQLKGLQDWLREVKRLLDGDPQMSVEAAKRQARDNIAAKGEQQGGGQDTGDGATGGGKDTEAETVKTDADGSGDGQGTQAGDKTTEGATNLLGTDLGGGTGAVDDLALGPDERGEQHPERFGGLVKPAGIPLGAGAGDDGGDQTEEPIVVERPAGTPEWMLGVSGDQGRQPSVNPLTVIGPGGPMIQLPGQKGAPGSWFPPLVDIEGGQGDDGLFGPGGKDLEGGGLDVFKPDSSLDDLIVPGGTGPGGTDLPDLPGLKLPPVMNEPGGLPDRSALLAG